MDLAQDYFDVIVVGGGISGGLSAAAYLQKAGCSVLVIERDEKGAPFSSFYEKSPGVRFDVTPVNFSIVSPAIADLDLGSYGYEIKRPVVLFSTLDGAGRSLTLYADAERTRTEFSRYSEKDALTFQRLLKGLNAAATEIMAATFFTDSPDKAECLALTAKAVGLDANELKDMTAISLVERLFESDAVRIALTALPAINVFGDLAAPGQGALSWLWTFLMRTCSIPANTPTLSQAVEHVFVKHGGTMLKGATVTRLLVDDKGVCSGAEIETAQGRRTVHSRRAVISDLGADLTGTLLQQPLRSGWRTDSRAVFTADVVLNRPLAWKSEGFQKSPRVYLLWDSWDDCKDWLQVARKGHESLFLKHIELTQFWVIYGCGEDGTTAGLRVRFATGPFIDENWDSRKEKYVSAIRDRIREIDAGVEIKSIDLTTPHDYWSWNPAARHGNPVGGDFIEGQWMDERLPYRTAIRGLYLANSVWPSSLSWMAPGYNVAGVVANDLDIPRPPWWSHTPFPQF
ncbi:MAG: NAD(P)/FAD-dependent oxidoreductase [Burkholderiaceae bacterium]|nr:MAG: NAD(P)/FAD-dependent oxidoreductase [Burkholderiaceae bacterium]TAM03091.1 MAG: NAD(P)/FAD-dependent oxidoreductase [Pusillimonas sp.]